MPLRNRVTPLSELVADSGRGLVYGNRGCLHDDRGNIRRRYAGHRPCALCRRADYDRFGSLWRRLHPGDAGADAIDARLHGERVALDTRAQRHHEAPLDDLPDGAFVLRDGAPWLVRGADLLRWTPAGYTARAPRPSREQARVITPPSLLSVLRTDWRPLVPLLHPSADGRPR
jgi:hypothetical protein